MIGSRTLAPHVVSACLLLTLAGCGTSEPEPTTIADPGSSEAAEESPEQTEAPESPDAACLVDREWHLDVPDITEQVTNRVVAMGMPVVSSEGTGSMTTNYGADGVVTSTGDVTFTLTVQAPDGPLSTLIQRQHGGGEGSWRWDGTAENNLAYESWESTYEIDITMSVGGATVDIPIELPDPVSGGSAMKVACSGQTLATTPDGSPFTQHWTTDD